VTVIYPSARVRFQMRLEEFANTERLDSTLENQPKGAAPADVIPATEAGKDAALTKVWDELSALVRRRSELSREEFNDRKSRLEAQRDRLLSQAVEGQEQEPASLAGNDPDDSVVIGSIQPIEAEIQRNGIRAADEFSLLIDHRDLPMDPRALRACSVVIEIGAVAPQLYSDGVNGQRADGELLSLVDLEFAPADGASELVANVGTRLTGWVDDWAVNWEDDGDTIRVSGRDMTSLLLDTPLLQQDSIDLNLPIRLGVERLVNQYKAMAEMKVVYGTPGAPEAGNGPVPSKAIAKTRKVRKGKGAQRAKQTRTKMKVWDHITDTCIALGLTPMVREKAIYLMKPRTFYSERGPAVAVAAYGGNIKTLQLDRKLGGVKVPTIEVRCYDSDKGIVRWARAPRIPGVPSSGDLRNSPPPLGGRRANQVEPSGVASDRIQTFVIKGINDARQLEDAADAIFEELGRQETQGRLTTDDITSWGGDRIGDLLNLQSGDAIRIVTVPPRDQTTPQEQTTTSEQELQAQTISARAEYLEARGWRREFARRMAETMTAATVANGSEFRVSESTIKFSQEEGLSIDVGFRNFLVIREQANEATPQGPGAAAAALAGNRQDDTSKQLLAASEANRDLTAAAAAGNSSPDDFAEGGRVTDEQLLAATQNRRRK